MESFTLELVLNSSAQLFSDKTLSFFPNFLTEQLNLECQWEVAISEISYRSMYQSVRDGKFKSFHKKLSKSKEFFFLERGSWFSITDIVEAKSTLIQERHNHSEKGITVKVSRWTQKVENYNAIEGSGLAFFSTDLTLSEVMLVLNLEYCWEEKNLTNQSFNTTLFAYTRSWYTRTWLNTLSWATRKLHCCVAFFFFEAQV